MGLLVHHHKTAEPSAARVQLIGDLIGLTVDAVKSLRFLVESGRTNLTIDLDGVSVLDTAGLGGLIKLLRYARERGGSVRLETSNETVRGILELTALSRVFKLRPTAKAA